MQREFTDKERARWNQVLLGCLHRFVDLCNEYNLTYFCVGGTVIGAVRHNGLIQWDDEIDVAMTRPDHERFLKITREKNIEGYEVASPDMKGYPYYFSKFCDAHTSLIELDNIPCLYGIYIDVFPIDGTASSRDEADKLMHRFKRVNNKINAVLSHLSIKEHLSLVLKPKEWGRMFFQTLAILFGRETLRRFLIHRLDSIAKKYNYNDALNIANYGGAWAEKEIHPKSWIIPLTKKRFEDLDVYIPGNYDQYLRQMYGDYMELPPVEKRVSHHNHAFYDLYRRVSS